MGCAAQLSKTRTKFSVSLLSHFTKKSVKIADNSHDFLLFWESIGKFFTLVKQWDFLPPAMTKGVFLTVLIMLHIRRTVIHTLISLHPSLDSIFNTWVYSDKLLWNSPVSSALKIRDGSKYFNKFGKTSVTP